MTGNLQIKLNKSVQTYRTDYNTSTTPSDSQWMDCLVGFDSNNADRLTLRQVAHSDGYQGVQLEAHRVVNNSNYYNGLRMEINGSGSPRVTINKTAWLAALGLDNASYTTTNVLSLVSGCSFHQTGQVNKYGNIISCNIGIKYNASVTTSGKTLGTFASSVRPKIHQSWIMNWGGRAGVVDISTSGEIFACPAFTTEAIPANNILWFRATWAI